jgi:hypothetical protein
MEEELMKKLRMRDISLPTAIVGNDGYFEEVIYDEYDRVVYFKTPEGVEEWEYLLDTDMYTYHSYADGVVESWCYDFARRPILYVNNLGMVTSINYIDGPNSTKMEIYSTANENGMVVAHHVTKQPMMVYKYQDPYNHSKIGEYRGHKPTSGLLRDGNGGTMRERRNHHQVVRTEGTVFDRYGDEIGTLNINIDETVIDVGYRDGDLMKAKTLIKDTISGKIVHEETESWKIDYNKHWNSAASDKNHPFQIKVSKSNHPVKYNDGYDDNSKLPLYILEAISEFMEENGM